MHDGRHNAMTQTHVLFIHGAGAGAHGADAALAQSLRVGLGAGYTVLYPQMPEEEDTYEAWRAQLLQAVASVGGPLILVAHSAGGSVVLKYLADEPDPPPLAGLFLIATPYWGAGGWRVDTFCVDDVQASRRLEAVPLFLSHSRDDAVVPFAHLARHAAAFPHATVRVYADRGHQLQSDLSDIAAAIRRLQDGHPA
jgi:uncharacterized protein